MCAVWATSNSALSFSGQPTTRSKTFAVPVKAVSLLPNTQYNFTVNGINMNWACQPFGGTLGAKLVSSSNGTLHFKFLYDIQHNSGYSSPGANSAPINSRLTCLLQSNGGVQNIFYINTISKPTQ